MFNFNCCSFLKKKNNSRRCGIYRFPYRRIICKKKYSDYSIYKLDALAYAGNLERLKYIDSAPNYSFLNADICDPDEMDTLFELYNFDSVIHLAAESHVNGATKDPWAFAKTNILGTLNLLEYFKKNLVIASLVYFTMLVQMRSLAH